MSNEKILVVDDDKNICELLRLYLRWDVIMRNIIFAVGGAHCVKSPRPIITYHLKAIPHNSKCRYGERGAADAKPKAQIILESYRAFWQRRCRAAATGAVLKP